MLESLCFEIIQRCTNNCLFCSSHSSASSENIIEYELFEKTINYLIENGGVKEISISGGEPLLHPNLPDMVSLCKFHNIKVSLYTSGIVYRQKIEIDERYSPSEKIILERLAKNKFSFIDKGVLQKLKSVGLDKIVFDLQASECDEYDELMNTTGNMSSVLTSMLNAKFAGIQTEVHFIPMRINYHQIEDILELCDIGEIDGISILKFVPQGRGRKNEKKLALTKHELMEFCERVEQLRDKYKVNIRLGIPLTKADEHLCTAGYDKLSIRYDGLVLPCVAFKEMDEDILRDVLEKNGLAFEIFSIRHNLKNLQIRKGNNPIPICKLVY